MMVVTAKASVHESRNSYSKHGEGVERPSLRRCRQSLSPGGNFRFPSISSFRPLLEPESADNAESSTCQLYTTAFSPTRTLTIIAATNPCFHHHLTRSCLPACPPARPSALRRQWRPPP